MQFRHGFGVGLFGGCIGTVVFLTLMMTFDAIMDSTDLLFWCALLVMQVVTVLIWRRGIHTPWELCEVSIFGVSFVFALAVVIARVDEAFGPATVDATTNMPLIIKFLIMWVGNGLLAGAVAHRKNVF